MSIEEKLDKIIRLLESTKQESPTRREDCTCVAVVRKITTRRGFDAIQIRPTEYQKMTDAPIWIIPKHLRYGETSIYEPYRKDGE